MNVGLPAIATVSTNNSKKLTSTSETMLKRSTQVVSSDSAIQPNDFKYSLAMRAVARSLLESSLHYKTVLAST